MMWMGGRPCLVAHVLLSKVVGLPSDQGLFHHGRTLIDYIAAWGKLSIVFIVYMEKEKTMSRRAKYRECAL